MYLTVLRRFWKQARFEQSMEARANEVLDLRKAGQEATARQIHCVDLARQQEERLQVSQWLHTKYGGTAPAGRQACAYRNSASFRVEGAAAECLPACS